MKVFEDLTYDHSPKSDYNLMIGNPDDPTLKKCNIGDLPITTANLSASSVTTEKLADGAVTLSKLSSEAKPQRTSTLVIAASDASARSKSGADYVCTGVNDQEVIRTAINSIPDPKICLQLTEGTFYFDSDLEHENSALNLRIQGSGQGVTTLTLSDAYAETRFYPMMYFRIANFKISDLTIDGRNVSGAAGRRVAGLTVWGGSNDIFVEHVVFKNMDQALHTRSGNLQTASEWNSSFICNCAFRDVTTAIITENNNADQKGNFFISNIFIDSDAAKRAISLWSDFSGRAAVYLNNVSANAPLFVEPKVKAHVTNCTFPKIELLANSGCVIAHNSCDEIINNGPPTDTPNIIYGNYITSDNLADGAVTGEKLANGSVTQDKIGAYAVTTDKIENGAVTEAKIATGAITNGKLAGNSVTEDKLLCGYPVINVDRIFPFVSGDYTLPAAIAAIPAAMRIAGLIITFNDRGVSWKKYQFQYNDVSAWTDTSKWEKFGTPAPQPYPLVIRYRGNEYVYDSLDSVQINLDATVRIDVSKLSGIASVSGKGMYEEGSTCTVSCVVEYDYVFDGWYDTTGGAYTKVSGSMTWSFAVMDDRSLVARAIPDPTTATTTTTTEGPTTIPEEPATTTTPAPIAGKAVFRFYDYSQQTPNLSGCNLSVVRADTNTVIFNELISETFVEITVLGGESYNYSVSKEGYHSEEATINLPGEMGFIEEIDITMTPVEPETEEPTDQP